MIVIRSSKIQVVTAEGMSESRWVFSVALAREWRGVRPDDCLREIAETLDAYGLSTLHCDAYAGPQSIDLAWRYRLRLETETVSQQAKVDAYTDLATLVATDRLEFSPHPQVIRDLLSIRKRVIQSGYAIHLPMTSDGRHADFAPALMLAVRHASAAVTYDFSAGAIRFGKPREFSALGSMGGYGPTYGDRQAERSRQPAGILDVDPEFRNLPTEHPLRHHNPWRY